ncbi:MAG: hypothetical protein KDJ16_05115 [Hyphomicrobiales bacterium]|nr:hypothetical protein [Hyphomicrobiales bacterium]
MSFARPLAILGATVLICGGVLPALGQSSQEALVDRWLEALENSDKISITYSGKRYNIASDAVVISDLEMTRAAEPENTARIGSLSLSGVTEDADGMLKAANFAADAITIDDTDTHITIETTLLRDVELHDPDADGSEEGAPFGKPHHIELNAITITTEDTPAPIPVKSLLVDLEDFENDIPTHMAIEVADIEVGIENIEEAEPREMFKAMGYDMLKMGMKGDLNWKPDAGTASLESFEISFADMGALRLSGVFGGIPAEALEKATELGNSAGGTDGQPMPPGGELLETLTVDSLTLSFTNHSIVERLLEQQAKQMGIKAYDLKLQVQGVLPQMLVALQNQAFQDDVTDAVRTFLDDPQTLVVTARPEQPVLVAQAFGMALMAPQQLIPMLALGIFANQ